MHIVEKLDQVADKLVVIVENLQELRSQEDDYKSNIQELLAIALHYCNVIVTTKELAEHNNLSAYKNDIVKQIKYIEDFIMLTEDLSFVA
jgi:uncharacterized coiled-coil DUF342 family protein